MNAALYARYSDDKQRDASIEDQLRLCRLFVQRRALSISAEYIDPALTGSTLLLRPGIQAVMQDAMRHRFDVLVAESLDRFSRDQEDTAGLFKRLKFLGISLISLITLAEGEITELHVGFKGTMNALYLKDLADKTRRGLRGRVEAGRSGGGRCYGYRVLPSAAHEGAGARELLPAEAAVVRRIFESYADGLSPEQIAKRLNAEAVPGPSGGPWGPSTIHGNWQRGTGVLNNELYIGRLVWNRLRYMRDPETGKRVSRLNPPADWITVDVPQLRIVSDEMWTRAKQRQKALQHSRPQTSAQGASLSARRRPKYLFSGMTKCGVCGGGFHVRSGASLACFSAESRGTCANRLTIRREEVEGRVLAAVQDKLLAREPFEEFCRDFATELNRLRMEARATVSARRHELTRIAVRSRRLSSAQGRRTGAAGQGRNDRPRQSPGTA